MKELDELLKEEDVSLNIDKTINKRINKTISSKVIKILLCLCLIITSLTLGILTIYDLSSYNPYNEEDFLPDNQDINYDEFNVLLSTYIQMHYPGQVCICKEIEEGMKKRV